jgi:hypothetical protein
MQLVLSVTDDAAQSCGQTIIKEINHMIDCVAFAYSPHVAHHRMPLVPVEFVHISIHPSFLFQLSGRTEEAMAQKFWNFAPDFTPSKIT